MEAAPSESFFASSALIRGEMTRYTTVIAKDPSFT